MSNIFKIFRKDLRGLVTNFFALVVAIGLCILPALYAWFNIYSNWDPYGNTGNIQIAVANLDEGWTTDEGEFINMGDDLEEQLRAKTTIDYVFLDTEEEAVDGISAGTYYAAVVIDSDFTYSMYNSIMESIDNPKITYYVNGKKNAVATKITDSAVGSIKTTVNEQFIRTLAQQLFTDANGVSDDLEEDDVVGDFMDKLAIIQEKLDSYDEMIDSFIKANEAMIEVMNDASGDMVVAQGNIEEGAENLEEAQGRLDETSSSFNQFSGEVSSSLYTIEASINKISAEISAAKLDTDVATLQTDIDAIKADASDLLEAYGGLEKAVSAVYEASGQTEPSWMSQSIQAAELAAGVISAMGSNVDLGAMTGTSLQVMQTQLGSASSSIEELRLMYVNSLVPNVNNLLDSMKSILCSAETMMNSLGSAAGHVGGTLESLAGTFDALNMSMDEFQSVIRKYSATLSALLEVVEGLEDSDALAALLTFLSGDPDVLADFFSEPVQVESHYIYEIANYGSGVAPFYTTLAIWVGMTILVSLVKVHAEYDDLKDVKPHQLFLGRYILFFLLSQLQALIIVLGDLYILKIQCVEPFYFWLAAAMASFTFSLLVYALTISFGDIGKALAVVVMVIQIAGSGGTYPIEALPTFFQKVYIFFPFPYAIDAMRECIGGMYQGKYMTCMLQMGLFCVAALIVGLVIRKPFIHVNHFIEERMEDTEIL